MPTRNYAFLAEQKLLSIIGKLANSTGEHVNLANIGMDYEAVLYVLGANADHVMRHGD